MVVKGISTIRLHRLHFSSSPRERILAISWPHSHRLSLRSMRVEDTWLWGLVISTVLGSAEQQAALKFLVENENDY